MYAANEAVSAGSEGNRHSSSDRARYERGNVEFPGGRSRKGGECVRRAGMAGFRNKSAKGASIGDNAAREGRNGEVVFGRSGGRGVIWYLFGEP